MAIRTLTRGGARWYVDPDTGAKVPGVTSIINALDKPFLSPWAAKMVAEFAVENWNTVQGLIQADPAAAVDLLKAAPRRYTQARAELGSKAHDLFERMLRGESPRYVEHDLIPYRDHFAEFLDTVRPELVAAEEVVWSDRFQYAGSFDALLRVWLAPDRTPTPDRSGTPHLIIVDWKTSKEVYPTVSLQLSAYAYADRLISADGTSRDMPRVDGGAVLHVTAERWSLVPVRVDAEMHQVFLALREALEWQREESRAVLGSPLATGGRLLTGTQRRA